MTWTVGLLPKADHDLADLVSNPVERQSIKDAIFQEFSGMKGARVSKLFRQGVSTASVDRLSAFTYPGSIRLQVRTDYRATILCLPAFEQAYVTHIFHKSHDPDYRRAAAVHDARAAEYIETFQKFLEPKKR